MSKKVTVYGYHVRFNNGHAKNLNTHKLYHWQANSNSQLVPGRLAKVQTQQGPRLIVITDISSTLVFPRDATLLRPQASAVPIKFLDQAANARLATVLE